MQDTARTPRLALAALLAFAALIALLPSAARAQDTPPVPQCNAGQFCLWVNASYAGGRFASAGSDGDLRNNTFAGTSIKVANNSSSLKNAGTQQAYDGVRIYYNLWSPGPTRCVPRGTAYANLTNVSAGSGLNWNNNIVKYYWTTDC